MSNYTEKDIDTLNKIEWEGGVAEALEYGIKTDDFDSKELKEAWWQLEYHWLFTKKHRGIIEQAIEEVIDE